MHSFSEDGRHKAYKIDSCTGILCLLCESTSDGESCEIASQLALECPQPQSEIGQPVSCGEETGVGLVQSCVGLGREGRRMEE